MHIVTLIRQGVSSLGTLIPFAKAAAGLTTTTTDDKAVAALEQVQLFLSAALENDAVVQFLEFVLNDHDVQTQKDGARNAAMFAAAGRFDGTLLAKVKELLDSLGLDWQTVLPLVVRLLLTFAGKRG